MSDTLSGEYQGAMRKTGSSGKPYYAHSIKVGDKLERFTSFTLPDALRDALGMKVEIPITKTEAGFANFDPTRQITLEVATIGEVKAKSNAEEELKGCLKSGDSILEAAIPQEIRDKMTPYEYSDLVLRLAITLWIQKR